MGQRLQSQKASDFKMYGENVVAKMKYLGQIITYDLTGEANIDRQVLCSW